MRTDKGIAALLRWLDIREENGRPFPGSLDQLRADIDHSSLLYRLYSGKEPLPEAPPRAMSYPDYELVETGKGLPYDVSFHYIEEKNILYIEQMQWRIIEKINDKEYVVSYGKSQTKWSLKNIGFNPRDPERIQWQLERIDS